MEGTIRKKPRRLNPSESTSSVKTEASSTPLDVLELGKYLVRELGLEPGVDTLGRWLAHRIAELIDDAEKAPTKAARRKAEAAAIDTILKVWEKREDFPRELYPLAPYKGVLKMIDALQPSNDQYRLVRKRVDERLDELASQAFDTFSRLMINLILLKLPENHPDIDLDAVSFRASSEEEKHILTTLAAWIELFEKETDDAEISGRRASEAKRSLRENAVSIAHQLLVTIKAINTILDIEASRSS
jgi:hypothetical protein